jgi:NAD(P)-dependent dehydrogenase (short-subunit alcohol dehydrogenase family)
MTRIALITGGNRGLGRAAALALAQDDRRAQRHRRRRESHHLRVRGLDHRLTHRGVRRAEPVRQQIRLKAK